MLDKAWGSPRITKDGVTVAKEIELSDKFENMGAQMVREVATKTADLAGDGTTTAIVLAQAIVREGAKAIGAGAEPDGRQARHRPGGRRRGRGDRQACPDGISTNDEIAQVGTISANGERRDRGHDPPRRWRRSATRA